MNAKHITLLITIAVVMIMAYLNAGKRQQTKETFNTINETTPSEWTAFHYICNIKGWNCSTLTPGQRRVLHSMRTLYNAQFTPTGRVFSRKDAIVIPREHFAIFDRNENDTNNMTLNLPNGNTVTLKYTNQTDEPQGLVYETDSSAFADLVQVLQALYLIYDSRFLRSKERLEKQIADARAEESSLRNQWIDLNNRAWQLEWRASQTRRTHQNLLSSIATAGTTIQKRERENSHLVNNVIPNIDKAINEGRDFVGRLQNHSCV